MEGIIFVLILLTALFWIGVLWLIISGIIAHAKAETEEKKSSAKKRIIIGVIILIIGGGYCGSILF